MSRIGKRPISLPKGVTVTIRDGEHAGVKTKVFEVKGPKGTIVRPFPSALTYEAKGNEAMVTVKGDVEAAEANRMHGTARALIAASVLGVTDGYKKRIKLEGTGYKVDIKGQMLNLSLGLSHPVNFELPKIVTVKLDPNSKGTVFELESFDKEVLGQTVANLQSYRMPEPYKGKGVQVEGQKIRRKAGKAGKAGGKAGK